MLLGIFSIATPLGIAIGMIASTGSDVTEIVFQSLAGGTFVYIACSEVIVEEFSVPKGKFVKMCFFILGACFILGLGLLE